MRFKLSRTLRAAPEVLFELLRDYGRRRASDPCVANVAVLSGGPASAASSVARCTVVFGLSMGTRDGDFSLPRLATVRMVGRPWPFQNFARIWRIVAAPAGDCRLEIAHNLQTLRRLRAPDFNASRTSRALGKGNARSTLKAISKDL